MTASSSTAARRARDATFRPRTVDRLLPPVELPLPPGARRVTADEALDPTRMQPGWSYEADRTGRWVAVPDPVGRVLDRAAQLERQLAAAEAADRRARRARAALDLEVDR